jgi:Uncharacterised nucleotidyltransferase
MSRLALDASLNQTSLRTKDVVDRSFQPAIACFSLLLAGDHDAAASLFRDGNLTAAEFCRFVEQHRLRSPVQSLLRGSALLELLPGQWLGQIKAFSLSQWARKEALVRELGRISTLLAAAGHDFILLKGPYIAARFYGGIDRREYWDLDILIKRERLGAVEPLLCSAGYVRRSWVLVSTAVTSRFTHAFDFVKGNVSLDLHWLLSANAAHYLDYEAIWGQRQTFALGNRNFSVLSDEYEAVFNLISIFKDLERGAVRLKSFVDLYFILRQLGGRIDWEIFLAHRRREKIQRISVNVLAFFFELFNCRREFPEVAAALERERRHVEILPSGYHQALIDASPGAVQNKQWAAGIYECSRLHVFLWWLVSLPFRLAVHDSGNYDRFKCWLQHATGIQRPTQNR